MQFYPCVTFDTEVSDRILYIVFTSICQISIIRPTISGSSLATQFAFIIPCLAAVQ